MSDKIIGSNINGNQFNNQNGYDNEYVNNEFENHYSEAQINDFLVDNSPVLITKKYPKEIETIGPLFEYQYKYDEEGNEVHEKNEDGQYQRVIQFDENNNPVYHRMAKWDDKFQYDLKRGKEVYDDFVSVTEHKSIVNSQTMIDDVDINKLADLILKEAIEDKAEDTLIVQYEHFGIVRHYDGETFYNQRLLYKSSVDPLITVLKKRAGLKYDLKNSRVEQTNGQIVVKRKNQENINFRVASDSNQYGMFLDMRQQAVRFESLDDLNLPEDIKSIFRQAIKAKDGLTIVGGPPGSGKTTLMTTGLIEYQKKAHANILSLEQPIETPTPGIIQKDIDEEYGMSWDQAIDAALRERPQIIRVGETSTRKTAQAIVRAASTGINALTTLHIQSAIEVFETLKSLGVEENDIKNSLKLVVYINRVPRLCPYCREQEIYTPLSDPDVNLWVQRHLNDSRQGGMISFCHRHKEGCKYCRANQSNPDLYGTLGKIGVYEYLRVNRPMLRIYRRYRHQDAYVLKDKLLHPDTITWDDPNDPDKKDLTDAMRKEKARSLASGLEYYSLERDVLSKLNAHEIDFETARYLINE